MSTQVRLIWIGVWVVIVALTMLVLAPRVRAQSGKAQSLCTPFINSAGNVSCIPVGMTGGTTTAPYNYNWLPIGGVANAAAPAYTEGRLSGLSLDLSGNLRVSGTFTPSGASPEFTPVAPATATATVGVLLGGQYDSTQKTLTNGQQAAYSASPRGALFVAVGADGFAVTNAGTFAVQATLPTTPLIASGNGVIAAPTSVNTGATTRASSTAAESNRVLKSSAGNLYDLDVVIGATSGYLLLFDATALPSNGAVTPVFCDRINSDGTAGGAKYAWPMPFPFATGITAGFSTTGCFTLTASATASFFGGYK